MVTIVVNKSPCGFCQTGSHGDGKPGCSIAVKHQGRHEKYPTGVVWVCPCTEGECSTRSRRKCADCGNRVEEEVSADTFTCIDSVACHATVSTRRENDPFLASLREIKERVNMAKVQENAEKAAKAEKAKEPTFCLVTGEPTKGGLFKPGMDARYVSERVATVADANFTAKAEKEQRGKMKADGVSERLVAKFEKSLALAKEKAEKKAAADAEKKAAKAEKASA